MEYADAPRSSVGQDPGRRNCVQARYGKLQRFWLNSLFSLWVLRASAFGGRKIGKLADELLLLV